MLIPMTALCLSVSDPATDVAVGLILARAERLSQVRVGVEQDVYQVPADAPVLYREAWRSLYPQPFIDELVIVRPDVLNHSLTDYEDYRPFECAVVDGTYVRHTIGAADDVWTVNGKDVQVGRYAMHPLLFAYDLHIQDSVVPQLSLERLAREGRLAVALSGADGYRLTGSVEMFNDGMRAYTQLYDVELSATGVPLRFRVENQYTDFPDLQSSVWELQTLETTEVNGAEFPTDVVITISNPNVNSLFLTLHEFRTVEVQYDPALTKADVTLTPILRKAYYIDGAAQTGKYYDADGALVREWRDGQQAPVDDETAARGVDVGAQTIRHAALPTALVLGLGAAALTTLRLRRHSTHGAGVARPPSIPRQRTAIP